MLGLYRTQVKLKLKRVFSFEIGCTCNTAAKRESLPQGLSFKMFRGADSLQSQTVYSGVYHIPFALSPLELLLAAALDGCAGRFLPY